MIDSGVKSKYTPMQALLDILDIDAMMRSDETVITSKLLHERAAFPSQWIQPRGVLEVSGNFAHGKHELLPVVYTWIDASNVSHLIADVYKNFAKKYLPR